MDAKQAITQAIIEGKTVLGIELGSTRIKAVLIGESYGAIASGGHDWENRQENGVWTYSLEDVWTGLRLCFRNLADDVQNRYGAPLVKAGAIGISAMMHGYLVFDKDGKQLVPFRTWRNTVTEDAAAKLTDLFQFNIPQRWSIAHLYQAILNGEDHVKNIDFMTTLAGYVQWKLTGKKVIGLGDASGMFPVDGAIHDYDHMMLERFNNLGLPGNPGRKVADILPVVLRAGETAGFLTEDGARLLDPDGSLQAGIPFCPPEGDADAGMVATNTIAEYTGSISVGTSVYILIATGKKLSKVYPEIGVLATPEGKPVALAQSNNGTTDLDAWVKLFMEVSELAGAKIGKAALYDTLYNRALEADKDADGFLAYNYHSGEYNTGMEEGRPLFVRLPGVNFSLANFMRTLLFSCLGSIKYGIDILAEKEKVRVDTIVGHGGFFKTRGVGQRFIAAAFNAPVSVMQESAGEGGAWGIALLAAFMLRGGGSLEQFLAEKVFAAKARTTINPDPKDVESFGKFMKRYAGGLGIERAAIENLPRR